MSNSAGPEAAASSDADTPAAAVEVMSRRLGLFATRLYAVFTTPTGQRELDPNLINAHLDHQRDLEARGVLFGAGPLFGVDGKAASGEGLIILRAPSLEAAHEIAARDPMHVSGARSFQIRPWLLNEGSFTVTTRLSNLSAEVK